MRFHVVSLPHTQVTQEFSACAYTEKVRKFCNMMTDLGHEVFLYAGEKSEAKVTAHIPCISEDLRQFAVGAKPYFEASFDWNLPHWKVFNQNATKAIKKLAKKEDFLCVIGGIAHSPIAKALPELTCVEFGIGYPATFAKYRVWESYAWMHTCYGAQQGAASANGCFFDEVIPGYYDPEQFEFSAEKDDYFLYVGRLVDRKGYKIAQEVCARHNVPLKLAGSPIPENPGYGTFVGHADPLTRSKLMSRAKALFVPTLYLEPFGNVAVEAQACGTPVICTDWGAMTETVIQGVTGYRCRMFQDFLDAVDKVHTLHPKLIRDHAYKNYSMEVIARKYEYYFERLLTLWGKGWYEVR